MGAELSRRLGRALGSHLVSPRERDMVVAAEASAQAWDGLPAEVRALVEEVERRPPTGSVAVVASVRELWLGCVFCLNPRHPGPCAKPKADTGPAPKGGAGGAGGGGGSGAHGEEGSMRPSLRDAKTTEDVSAVVAAEASAITGRKVRCDMAGSDPQIAREHGEAVLQDLEMFPQANVNEIHTFGPGSAHPSLHYDTAYAVRIHGTSTSAIGFNVDYAGNPERYRASLKADGDAGWLSAATPAGVAHHEFGHVIAGQTSTATASKKHVVGKAKAAGVKPSALAREQVSGYAVTNPHELAAEAFADVVTHGGDASQLSQEIFAIVDGGYRYQAGELV